MHKHLSDISSLFMAVLTCLYLIETGSDMSLNKLTITISAAVVVGIIAGTVTLYWAKSRIYWIHRIESYRVRHRNFLISSILVLLGTIVSAVFFLASGLYADALGRPTVFGVIFLMQPDQEIANVLRSAFYLGAISGATSFLVIYAYLINLHRST